MKLIDLHLSMLLNKFNLYIYIHTHTHIHDLFLEGKIKLLFKGKKYDLLVITFLMIFLASGV